VARGITRFIGDGRQPRWRPDRRTGTLASLFCERVRRRKSPPAFATARSISLVVYKVDRLTRSLADFAKLTRSFADLDGPPPRSLPGFAFAAVCF
jgi:hypothetical protein